MNRRQKTVVRDFILVAISTAVIILGMFNFKDWINRSEAMFAMEHIGQQVLSYRKEHGAVPPRSYVDRVKLKVPGQARLNLIYRARWIEFDCSADEILAYSPKNYRTFILGKGSIVLRLDELMGPPDTISFASQILSALHECALTAPYC